MSGFRFGVNVNDASYGKGIVVIEDAETLGDAHAEEISERLASVFRSPEYTPPVLPAAAIEVHRLSQTKDAQIEQILSALEKDPLLAARVLKVASSPVYGGQQVQSLQNAVMRLGMRTLAALVWEVALNMKVFRCKAYEGVMETVRRHSTATAYVARVIAKQTPVPLEYAFLCGLLHDVGAAAALLLLGEGGSNSGAKALSGEVLQIILKKSHAEGSQLVAKLWGLPVDVQLVLANHHNVSVQGYAHPTAAIIAIAELVLREEAGKAAQGLDWDDTHDHALIAARDALSITPKTMEAIRKDARQIMAKLEKS
ncbi:MAG TPA: HDOD domain-containing protein [Polyangiales bacterium]